jgi:hypothetical protein
MQSDKKPRQRKRSTVTNYNLAVPETLWEDWKLTVSRAYPRLGDRVIELIALDLACNEELGHGIIEHADRNEIIAHERVTEIVEAMENADDAG